VSESVTQLLFNESQHTLCIGNHCVKLEPLIARALLFFLEHKNTVIERRVLMEALWRSHHVSDDAINRMICTLRRNLQNCLGGERGEFVETIPRVGYCFHLPEHVQINETDDLIVEHDYAVVPQPETSMSAEPGSLPHTIDTRFHALSEDSLAAQSGKVINSNASKFKPELRPEPEQKTLMAFSLIFVVLIAAVALFPLSTPATNNAAVHNHDNEIRIHVALITTETNSAEDTQFAQRFTMHLTERLTQTLPAPIRVFFPTEKAFSGQHYLGKNVGDSVGKSAGANTETAYPNNVVTNTLFNATLNASDEPEDYTTQIQGRFIHNASTIELALQVVEMESQSLGFADSIQLSVTPNNLEAQKHILLEEALAALHLYFLYKNQHQTIIEQYNHVKDSLGYRGIERLVEHNIALRTFEIAKVTQTIADLLAWQQTHPGHSTIQGQLAYAYLMQVSLENKGNSIQPIQFARQTLDNEPNNLDALLTLYHHYNDFASTQLQAEHYYQQILHHYPNHPDGYHVGFRRQVQQFQTCNSLHYVVHEGKPFVSEAEFNSITSLLTDCTQQQAAQSNSEAHNAQYLKMVKRFRLTRHTYFKGVIQSSMHTPNQRNFSELYQQYLALNDKHYVNYIEQRLNFDDSGYWSWLNTLYSYHYNRQLPNRPTDYLAFMQDKLHGETDWYFVTALIKQVRQENLSKNLLYQYLAHSPSIDHSLMNIQPLIGLIRLQHQVLSSPQTHTSIATDDLLQITEAHHHIITQLHQQLEDYWKQDPASYKFWGLGRYHLVVSLFAQNGTLAQTILDERFSDNEAWWQHDFALMQETLSPWRQQNVVKAYINRIQTDAIHARKQLL